MVTGVHASSPGPRDHSGAASWDSRRAAHELTSPGNLPLQLFHRPEELLASTSWGEMPGSPLPRIWCSFAPRCSPQKTKTTRSRLQGLPSSPTAQLTSAAWTLAYDVISERPRAHVTRAPIRLGVRRGWVVRSPLEAAEERLVDGWRRDSAQTQLGKGGWPGWAAAPPPVLLQLRVSTNRRFRVHLGDKSSRWRLVSSAEKSPWSGGASEKYVESNTATYFWTTSATPELSFP
ncbi:uncharacterized protein LOC132533381 [Erinaceus europaeus]|uniref:Uncharacterized protein LOC132533381 n=1 Tax=Erinaceus europaeus TaxID=9365 RepID=A0ABM3W0S0_ERIEU|nr:uncharacterized protein LOC132533381 [Erinaceus europaeus]